MTSIVYRFIGLVLITVPFVAGCAANKRTSVADYDLFIRNGLVIDGTGTPGYPADVLVRGDRIVRIGRIDPQTVHAAHVIDASGKVVTPGFIDAHSHGDPLATPALENFLAMGVTTICIGQDGESPPSLAEWMHEVEQTQPGTNVATFVGHGTLRELAGVEPVTVPTPGQMQRMQSLVRDAMQAGCLGLSTALEYQPGSFADLDELVALAEPVGRAGGLVMSHMRSEDDDQIEAALAELLAQGERASSPVHVSHIKVVYGHGACRAEQILALMVAARERGERVTADIYPYNASYTGIGIVFPAWAKPPYDYAAVVRERRAELAAYLRQRVVQRNGPEATLLATPPWTGKTLAQVAREAGKPFEDVLIDDIGLDGADAAYFVMDAALQERLLLDPHVMICSDGSQSGHHPRGHGAFARVIREFVTRRHLLTLEAAVYKMTGLTAATVGLDGCQRGRLAEGFAADVLVFDPQAVHDMATYETPHQLARGFDWVIVNGKIARSPSGTSEVRAGRLLRHAAQLVGPDIII